MFYDHLNRKYWNPLFRGLSHDSEATHLYRMGQAIWLYLYLLIEAHEKTGRVSSSYARMSRETGIAEATLMSWLGQLRKHNYVSTRSQGDYLEIKLAKWKQVPHSEDARPRGGSENSAGRRAINSSSGHRKAEEKLAGEIAKSLNDLEHLEAYRTLCRDYSREQLLRVRDQVLTIPDSKIRKSRGALFTYLLKYNGMEKQK